MKQRLLTIGAGLLALGAGVLLYVRTSAAPRLAARQTAAATAEDLYVQGQRAFAPLASVRLADLHSEGEVASVLASAWSQAPMPAGAGTREALLAHVAEFLYHRFAVSDPVAYRAWRESAGYQLVAWPELDEMWRLGEDYEHNIGPVPGEITSSAAFDALWEFSATPRGASQGNPVGLVSDARGLVVSPGVRSRIKPERPRIQGDAAAGGFSADIWGGRSNAGFSRWYGSRHRAATLNDAAIMRSQEPFIFADVACVLVFEDGARIPVSVGTAWDPEHGVWSIETLVVLNARPGQLGAKVF